MSRVKTFVNGGTVLPGDLDAIEDDYEVAFGAYKVVLFGSDSLTPPNTGSTPGPGFYLDPAWFWTDAATSSTNPRAVKYNLAVRTYSSDAQSVSGTFSVCPINVTNTSGGPSYSVGTAITGSTVTVGSFTGGGITLGASGDFTAPAAGPYGFNTHFSGALVNGGHNGQVDVQYVLLVRQI